MSSSPSPQPSTSKQQQQQPPHLPHHPSSPLLNIAELEPQPGPSTSAAEFDLEVFDSGSSCSLEDCWGGNGSKVDPLGELSRKNNHRRGRHQTTTANASLKAKAKLRKSKKPMLKGSYDLEDEEEDFDEEEEEEEGLDLDLDGLESDSSSSSSVSVSSAVTSSQAVSVPTIVSTQPVEIIPSSALEEPPISACPSETEEAPSEKEEEEEGEGNDDGEVEHGNQCHCPTYMNHSNVEKDKKKEVAQRWTCADSLPSTSAAATPTQTTTTPTSTSLVTEAGNKNSSKKDSDITSENIDEIVNDHDTFGTDENEDSLDSETLDCVRYDRLLQGTTTTTIICQNEDEMKGVVKIVTPESLNCSSFPTKRKSGASNDDSIGDDECCSSVKKQCILAPDQTIEIASGNSEDLYQDEITRDEEADEQFEVVGEVDGDEEEEEDFEIVRANQPPPKIMDWLVTFSKFSQMEKVQAIDSFIGHCHPTQVRHMMAVIEPQFQRDFISLLPKELALYVLSFLTPRDLLRAAQTCCYWRILCEDNLLWREKCRESNLQDSFRDIMRSRAFMSKKSSKNSNLDQISNFPYSQFKSNFMRAHNIEMNWRVRPVKQVKVLKGHDDHVITCLQFSEEKIVSGSDDNTLKVWSAVTGKCLRTLVGHTGGVWSSQMQDGIIVSGSTDRTLKVWDAEKGQCVHTLYGHTSTVRCMHLHKNTVVSGSRDATLRMWDLKNGECLHVLVGHVAAVRCVQYDGRLVVSGAYDYMVKVWNPETEECLHTLSGHTNRVYSLQFDGVHVVSGSLDTSIRVWDVESGACKHALMGHQSLTSGMELRNNILVSGNADSTVKVWDITSGQCLQTLSGPNKHQSAVTCLQFNSKFVITSSDDGTVKLWDVNTGEFIRDLVALDSGGSGGVVWRIRANPTKLVCAVGSRNGTEETKLLVIDFDDSSTTTTTPTPPTTISATTA